MRFEIKFKGDGQYKPKSMSMLKWYKVINIQYSIKLDQHKNRYQVAHFWIIDNNSKLLPVSNLIAEIREREES